MDTQTVATIPSILGVLFLLASSFSILPSNIAIFLGIACFIIAGAVWSCKSDN
ncbi:hypothetical protein KFU94_42425 [Chloroflexi bacterium TSY]|nr:hypothetical protein [Chloroflexi bacterium TSY]